MNRFEVTPLLDIKDNMTGKEYPVEIGCRQSICNLLNAINNRADLNAELCCSMVNEIEEYRDVLKKYNIDSVEKLDKVLFYARKW